MTQLLSGMSTRAKILAVALCTAVLAGAGPALAHGVEHALFAHNADKVDSLDSTALQSRVTQVALKRSSIPANKTGYSVATATISVPQAGGALVALGLLEVDYDSTGTIGTAYIQYGSGCGAGGGDAWWDTYSTFAGSATPVVTKKVPAGSATVQLCAIAAEPLAGKWQDTTVPLLGGGLTVLWIPKAGAVTNLGRFGSVTTQGQPTTVLSAAERAAALDRAARRTLR